MSEVKNFQILTIYWRSPIPINHSSLPFNKQSVVYIVPKKRDKQTKLSTIPYFRKKNLLVMSELETF